LLSVKAFVICEKWHGDWAGRTAADQS